MSTDTLLRPLPTPTLPPIGLAELNSAASLQSRIDTKYLVPAQEVAELPMLLPRGSRVLEIDGRRDFTYYSVNFDTANLLSYQMSAFGRRRRFKVRTRAYVDSEQAFLEVKVRGARGENHKARIPHDFDRLGVLSAADRYFISYVLREAKIDSGIAKHLSPYLATGYQRTTYLAPGDFCPTRVTADTGIYWEQLRAIDADAPRMMEFRPTLGIIETKSRLVSNPTNHILWRSGRRPQAFSKYCTGAALLDARLPANKWHQALQQLTDFN